MSESINVVPESPASIWAELTRAVQDLNHPWRTPALATEDGTVRTVVLRRISELRRELVFFTDCRSPKVTQLAASPKVEWLFYNPANGLQVRARAAATVHTHNETAEAAWRDVPPANRVNYCSPQAPGTPLHADGADEAAAIDQPHDGYQNFAVVTTQVDFFDWLLLALSGNRRRRLEFNSTANGWTATSLVP